MQIARGVIGAVVVGHYPLNQHPARLCIEDLEQYFFGMTDLPAWTSPVHTLAFVLSTLSVAVVVSSGSGLAPVPHSSIPKFHGLPAGQTYKVHDSVAP